jgi:CRISPR-associated protein Cas5t
MFYISIKTYTEMASFRIPETHTFQQTLPLPPITTLIGILGAAAGLSFEAAMSYCKENVLRFGVIGTNRGRFNDLWKYQKVKSDGVITAVLLREYIVDLEMELYIAAEKEALMHNVRKYFLDPYYALTAGSSDSLMKVKKISAVGKTEVKPLTCFSNTVIAGDHAGNYESDIDIRNVPLMRDIYAPSVHLLPVEFDFYGEERRVKARRAFTFIDTPIKLRKSVEGIEDEGKAVALL